MVNNKRRYTDDADGPPRMDESWWEAVLAEEESQAAPRSVRKRTRSSGPVTVTRPVRRARATSRASNS